MEGKKRYGYTTGTIRILSVGTAWRPNVHIEDIARAVIACLTDPTDEVGGEAFNVGMDDEIRIWIAQQV